MAFAKAVRLLRNSSWKHLFQFSKSNKTYIFPAPFGFAFAAMALVLLMMALAYSNNLVYFFVFFLISVAVSAMNITNQNVQRIVFEEFTASHCFANEPNEVSAVVFNQSGSVCYDFKVGLYKDKNEKTINKIGPQTRMLVGLNWAPRVRGKSQLPSLVLSSEFPFGLLKSWKMYLPKKQVIVFPERKGVASLPHSQTNEIDNQGVFREHTPYRLGQPTKRIDWKLYARHHELLIRTFEENESTSFDFSWEQTIKIDSFEDRISQLCLWIDIAEKSGHYYALILPRKKISQSKGHHHWMECLETLALLQKDDVL